MRPATAAGFDFERAFREALTFTSRRPGWLGGLRLTGLIIGAVLVIPVLFVFALFQILAHVIQAVAGVALWLVGMVLLFGLGVIFIMAFLKFSAWAVH
jgi:hypothetical protein